MKRAVPFFPLVPVFSLVAFAAACGDEGGSGGGGGSSTKAETTGSETTGSTTDSTTEASTSTGMMVDPCEGAGTVSFSTDVVPIFAQKCATTGCHVGSPPDGGLALDAANAHGATVGTATKSCGGDRIRVIAGDPAESYLWDKIHGTDLCGTSKKMPPATKPQLTDAEKQTITNWICGGALDD